MTIPTVGFEHLRLGPVELRCATVTLTDAQIKALPTTPITLVTAPGSGLAIVPIQAVLYSKTTAGAYTNINAAGVLMTRFPTPFPQGLSYVPNDAAITNGSATLLSDLLGAAANNRVTLVPTQGTEGRDDWGSVPFVEPTADFTNKALMIDIDNNGAGVLTGGNAANTMTVVVLYWIVTVP